MNDFKTFDNQTAGAKAQLKNSINTNWKAKNEAYVNSVKDVIREIKTPVTSNLEVVP